MMTMIIIIIIGYMDDVTLGGPRDFEENYVSYVIAEEINIRLHPNTDKSELITITASRVNLPAIDQFTYFIVNVA